MFFHCAGKDKIINGASLPNLRLPLIQRTLTPMSDLTVIDLKRESMEGKGTKCSSTISTSCRSINKPPSSATNFEIYRF